VECFIEAINKIKDYFGEEKKMKIRPAMNLGVAYLRLK
jgi:hypothetical protein